jgi:curved DNA-binding protein CbpA
MDYEKACKVLGISRKNTREMILTDGKKAYYKLALKYHPDKGGDVDKFREINEAWEIIKEIKGIKEDKYQDFSYSDLMKNVVNWVMPGTFDNLFIDTSLISILKNCQEMSFIMLEQMNINKALKAYELLRKYKDIFMIENDVLEKMEKIIQSKMSNDNIYILNPSIDDILNDKIYKLDLNDETIYFPLWHRKRIIKHPDQSNNILIVSQPDISNNIFISKNNDIFYSINCDVQTVFRNQCIHINIGHQVFKIDSKDITLTNESQIKKFKNQGILKINKENMFDQSKRSDIYIEITLIK